MPRPAKQYTEPAAWRVIARRIAEGKWGKEGLCREVDELYEAQRLSDETYDVMGRRIGQHLLHGARVKRRNRTYPNVAWAFKAGDADNRIVAALFLAEEAKRNPRVEDEESDW